MDNKIITLLREKLNDLISSKSLDLSNGEILKLSQKLDKHIIKYYEDIKCKSFYD